MTLIWVLLFVTQASLLHTALGKAGATSGDLNLGIIDGNETTIEDNPFMVSLCDKYRTGFCAGSIIHERFILTAAHCVVWGDRLAKVRMGSDRRSSGGVLIEIEARLCHQVTNNTFRDICLLKLKEPVQFGNKVNLVDLPGEDSEFTDQLAKVTGWGRRSCHGRKYAQILRQAMVTVLSDKRCREIFPPMTEYTLCAGANGSRFSYGDSGGPLTHNNVQIGVASYSFGCNVNPGYYTKVSKHLNWINTTIEDNL